MFASYIPSGENVIADELSRIKNSVTEWVLYDRAFQFINEKLGNPMYDLFANSSNTKCKNFVSWYADPRAFAVDAFTISWSKLDFYIFPPFSLILRCLVKICENKASGILVVPSWPNQPWFPFFKSIIIQKTNYLKT